MSKSELATVVYESVAKTLMNEGHYVCGGSGCNGVKINIDGKEYIIEIKER